MMRAEIATRDGPMPPRGSNGSLPTPSAICQSGRELCPAQKGGSMADEELARCTAADMHPRRRLAAEYRVSEDPEARAFAPEIVAFTIGERTVEYRDYLYSDDWRTYRLAVLARQRGECATCLRDATHCHHRTYARCGFERDDDCVALCADCHATLHKRT